MPSIAPAHPCLILDACCVINLYASGRLPDILRHLELDVWVAEYVRVEEALWLRRDSVEGSGVTRESIDLQPVIDTGLLGVVSLDTEDEEQSAVDFALALQDTGEAVTGAIALHRSWAVGTDDRKATSFFRRVMPQVQLVTTPDIVKHWVDRDAPSQHDVRIAVRGMEISARYRPSQDHPLRNWWAQFG